MSPERSIEGVSGALLSRSLAWACLALAVALPVWAAASLWRLPSVEWLARLGIGADVGVSTVQLITASVLAMLPVLALSFGLVKAWHCLVGLARGEVFALATVVHLRAFAGAAAIAALLGMAVPAISSVVLSWQAAPGQRALALNIASSDLLLVLFAGVIRQVASVLAQAVELAEEHAQIV